MRHEEFEAMVEAMCIIESVEDFDVVAVERELNPGTLVVLPAALALRLFQNDGGAELCAEWFAAMDELRSEVLEERRLQAQAADASAAGASSIGSSAKDASASDGKTAVTTRHARGNSSASASSA